MQRIGIKINMKKLYYFLAGLAVAVTGFAYMAQAAPCTPGSGGGTGLCSGGTAGQVLTVSSTNPLIWTFGTGGGSATGTAYYITGWNASGTALLATTSIYMSSS